MATDPSTGFPAALRAALRARGLTLTQVADELAARGLTVSLATLSYWSTGRSLPRRRTSQQVVTELEDVLGVPAGTLVSALAAGLVPHVEATDGCTAEAPVRVSGGDGELPGAWVLPVRPGRPLVPGEARDVGWTVRWEADGPVRGMVRPAPATLRWLVQEAWLGPDAAPAATHEVRATDPGARPVGAPSVVPVQGPDGHVQHATGQAPGGLHLLRW